MEEALIAILLANAGVAARVGARVWPGRAPQTNATYPFVTIRKASSVRDYVMAAPSGYIASRVQADVYGETYGATKLAARAVMDALSGFRGTQGSATFQGIFVDAERDLPTADEDDDVNNLFRASIDFMVHHA